MIARYLDPLGTLPAADRPFASPRASQAYSTLRTSKVHAPSLELKIAFLPDAKLMCHAKAQIASYIKPTSPVVPGSLLEASSYLNRYHSNNS